MLPKWQHKGLKLKTLTGIPVQAVRYPAIIELLVAGKPFLPGRQ
jgi:hypothetical protein